MGSIVISLRNDMFELAHRLVGIYKTSNVSGRAVLVITADTQQCTKSVAIDNKDLRTQAVPRPIAGAKNPAVPPTPRPNDTARPALAEDRRQSTATPGA
jgi:structural maintenance of chromosome 4